ncbi:MAG: hypothetical protein ABH878_09860, partial [bacterium]
MIDEEGVATPEKPLKSTAKKGLIILIVVLFVVTFALTSAANYFFLKATYVPPPAEPIHKPVEK